MLVDYILGLLEDEISVKFDKSGGFSSKLVQILFTKNDFHYKVNIDIGEAEKLEIGVEKYILLVLEDMKYEFEAQYEIFQFTRQKDGK